MFMSIFMECLHKHNFKKLTGAAGKTLNWKKHNSENSIFSEQFEET